MLPANLEVRREAKRAKLLQYAERVWQIRQGDEEQRIDAATQQTRTFFESLGLPTRLSAYQLGADAIAALINQLAAHRLTALGEHSDVNLDVSRRVLEASL